MTGIDAAPFLNRPGHRFPIHHTMAGVSFEGDDLRSVEKITLDGKAFAQLGTLYLDVEITAVVIQPCGRCLEPVKTETHLNESFDVPIPPRADRIELWGEALRLVLSAHDPHVLCRPTCRGLCPVCGTNLNDVPDHVCRPDRSRTTLGDRLR
jgi:uncharacterized protein